MNETDSMEARGLTAAQLESTPQGTVRRWLAEISMASKREKTWREEARDIRTTYKSEKTKSNAFNILWSNTDTLAPALFSSLPVPDVRRRFRDVDPVGKAMSTVIERTLAFELEQFDAEKIAKDAVLDMLLSGRGVIRVKYQPVFAPQQPLATPPTPMADSDAMTDPHQSGGDLQQDDRLLDETAPWEHVQWDDLRIGPGKRWDDVTWIGFRHRFTYDMAVEKFGKQIAAKMEFVDSADDDKSLEKDERAIFKTAEVWEIWDKEQRRVLFVAECYKERVCSEQADPLELQGFFPMPRPSYAVESSESLEPIPLYRLYKEQAKELDRVSSRINKVVDALKIRGAYMGNQSDLKAIIEASDNQMIPVQNLSGVAEMGGLDKAIWIMPIDKLINVLNGLYLARNEIKATIYELTGISDIVRGSTQASESATAQRLKSEWGSMRLQKMQKEIQRLLRDCMRIQADIYSMRYDHPRFAAITGMKLPTMQEKQQIHMQMMQQQQMAMQQPQMALPLGGQPPQGPDPQIMAMMQLPTWEEVIQMLRNDGLRSCRIDIETDSTIADIINKDMMGLAEVTEAIGQVIAGAGPAVQSGMLPVEVPKEIALSIARRARMGLAVEDAIDKIQQPPPMQNVNPEQQKQLEAGQKEVESGRAEIEQGRIKMQAEQQKGSQQINDGKMQIADQRAQMLEQQLAFVGQQAKQWQADAQKYAKMANDTAADAMENRPTDKLLETLLTQLMEAQKQTQDVVLQSMESINASIELAAKQSQANMQAISQMAESVNAPREVKLQRDKNGQAVGAVSMVRH
jgi:hypothetical protein